MLHFVSKWHTGNSVVKVPDYITWGHFTPNIHAMPAYFFHISGLGIMSWQSLVKQIHQKPLIKFHVSSWYFVVGVLIFKISVVRLYASTVVMFFLIWDCFLCTWTCCGRRPCDWNWNKRIFLFYIAKKQVMAQMSSQCMYLVHSNGLLGYIDLSSSMYPLFNQIWKLLKITRDRFSRWHLNHKQLMRYYSS